MTIDDQTILSIAEGKEVPGITGPAAATEAQENAGSEGDGQEESAGEAEGNGEEGQEQEGAESAQEAESVEGQQKKRSKYVPRERFDEINTQHKATQAELQATQLRLRNMEQFIESAAKQVTDPVKGQEIDPLDKEAYDAQQKEINTAKEMIASAQLENAVQLADIRGEQKFEHYEQAKTHLYAKTAFDIMNEVADRGGEITPEAALAHAAKLIDADIRDVHGRKKDIAGYLYNRALRQGFAPADAKAAAKPATKSTVNMQAVDRARQQAGAPAVKSAAAEGQRFDFKALVEEFTKAS